MVALTHASFFGSRPIVELKHAPFFEKHPLLELNTRKKTTRFEPAGRIVSLKSSLAASEDAPEAGWWQGMDEVKLRRIVAGLA